MVCFVYIGTYPSEMSARDDYEIVKDLHAAGAVGTYDAAVITKDDSGKVHVNKDETSTRHGAWGGIAVGAVVGLLFPPVDHRVRGDRRRGSAGWVATCGRACPARMSRSSVNSSTRERPALVVVGESTVEAAIDKAGLKAESTGRKSSTRAKDIDRPCRKPQNQSAAAVQEHTDQTRGTCPQ